jgi:predicted CoA-substrate-specific enzyme activase
MKTLGIDVGSQTTKAVILGDDGILAYSIVSSDDEVESSAKAAIEEAMNLAGVTNGSELHIVSTGVGGKSISVGQQQKTITTCLARGIHHSFRSARTTIDMGAESSTVIKVNEKGRIVDWANHDKCAAGTGIFLQQMAKLMQMSLEDMSMLSLQARYKADITGTCAVFAESEVVSHVHRDPPTPKEDIIAGIHYSVVSRVVSMCKRIGVDKDVAVVGGVALNDGLVKILEEEMGCGILVPDVPQIIAALGAAIIARENIEKGVK